MTKLFVLLFLLIPQLGISAEKVKVKWDCVLDRVIGKSVIDSVGCIDLKLAYYKDANLVESSTHSDMTLIIRSNPLENNVEYLFTTKWKDQAPYTWPSFELNSSLSQGEIMEQLLLFMDKINKTFISIANHGNDVEAPQREVPFYVSPSLYGSVAQTQGNTSLYGSGEVFGNYSTQKWRVVGSGYFGYRSDETKTTEFTPGVKSEISYAGASAFAVRDIKKVGPGRWDIAIFASHKDVTNNIDIDSDDVDLPENAKHNTARKTSITIGTEWIAIPFLTDTSSGNVSVRYSLSAENHQYIDPQSFEGLKELFAKHTLQVYLSKHFDKVDVNFSASAFTSSFRAKPLQGFSGSAGVTFKINPRMTVGANASLTYAKNRVMSPADGSMSFLGLTSGSTPLTYNGNLTLTYTLGNIRIFNKEQRWKD